MKIDINPEDLKKLDEDAPEVRPPGRRNRSTPLTTADAILWVTSMPCHCDVPPHNECSRCRLLAYLRTQQAAEEGDQAMAEATLESQLRDANHWRGMAGCNSFEEMHAAIGELAAAQRALDWLEAEVQKYPRQRWFVIPEGKTIRETAADALRSEAKVDDNDY